MLGYNTVFYDLEQKTFFDHVNRQSVSCFSTFHNLHYKHMQEIVSKASTSINIPTSRVFQLDELTKIVKYIIPQYQILMLKRGCTVNLHKDKVTFKFGDEKILKLSDKQSILNYGKGCTKTKTHTHLFK